MIRPLEETDPELAAQLQCIVSGKHETIKALYQHTDEYKVIRSEKLIESLQDSCFLPASLKQLHGRKHHEVLHFLHRL